MKFRLPDVGEGVTEADVVRWLVKEGDEMEADQPIVTVQTDKAVVELPTPVAGTVESIYWSEGDTVPVGEALLAIQEKGTSEHLHKTQEPASGSEPEMISKGNRREPQDGWEDSATLSDGKRRRRALATPSTRRLARNLGVNIHEILGTGPAGRVMKEDVRRKAAELADSYGVMALASQVTRSATKDLNGKKTGSEPSELPQAPMIIEKEDAGVEEPLSRTRRVIAERLLFSVTQKPHATHFDELNVEGLVAWRNRINKEAKQKQDRIGFLPILLKIVAVALRHHPLLNAHFNGEEKSIRRFSSVHLGVATDTPQGLLVPVIREVERKSILQIHSELQERITAAREGLLSREQMTGSTFTVSNAGSLGGVFATPIINPPEVAILALHPVEQRPVVEDGQLVPGWRMNVSLSFDHQALDGADAIRFTQRLGSFTSEPGRLLLELT
ncbi:dihydrolipoamide acetyltransferase family protein [Melghirimyces algeriensis]|uniref:Dihydrolipoamide acetyltransferase component of pyruvate dehydrogenase complex n=1 Tax=Melghirimyces algeriensis TaxID=910412 RepID=A0A521DGR3_9BACL|nr:dihydrolipoamide acetyltransferase family protein [Melghirimyces algeriensis]SMO70772.1 pyruvate dehydrogenase E2 component (dihydrolipoamide acetyltransferase) [Melghirimyces algeriensis]